MKNFIVLLCVMLSVSLASAQTTPNQNAKVVKKTTTTTNVKNDNTGVIDPTEAPAEGANSRDNSRQSNYNKERAATTLTTATTATPVSKTTTTATTTTKVAPAAKNVKDDNTGLIDPTEAPAEGANSRDNSRQSNYNKEPVKK